MAVDFSSKIVQTLYQSRFCELKDFDIIISGNTFVLKHSEERISFRISSRSFEKIETIYHSKRHSNSDRTICERSNVWNVRLRIKVMRDNKLQIKNKFVESFKIYLHKTDQWIIVIETHDDVCNFSAFSFMKNVYVFGGLSNKY